MTQREMLNAIIARTLTDEVVAEAERELAGLDKANSQRRIANAKKAAEKEKEKAPIREAIVACITAEPKTASMLIAEAEVEIKPQAIPSLLKGLVEEGTIVKVDVKIAGKGTQRGYALPTAD